MYVHLFTFSQLNVQTETRAIIVILHYVIYRLRAYHSTPPFLEHGFPSKKSVLMFVINFDSCGVVGVGVGVMLTSANFLLLTFHFHFLLFLPLSFPSNQNKTKVFLRNHNNDMDYSHSHQRIHLQFYPK